MNQEPTQAIVGGVEQTAPRVTIEQIEAEIEHEFYFTAAEGVHGTHEYPGSSDGWSVPKSMDRTLFCVLVLKNGMRVEGVNHGSVSAANYSVEYARKDAREKAIDKLWPMFGFDLAQKLHREKQAVAFVKHPNQAHHSDDPATEHLRDVVEHARALTTQLGSWVSRAQAGEVDVPCPVAMVNSANIVSSFGSSEGKFRKKPVVIEAVQIVKGMDILSPEWFAAAIQENKIITHGFGKFTRDQPWVEIPTLEGTMRGDAGDWIIQGVKGELYPCKPDIFAITYGAA